MKNKNKIVCDSCKNTECKKCKVIKKKRKNIVIINYSNYIFDKKKRENKETNFKVPGRQISKMFREV